MYVCIYNNVFAFICVRVYMNTRQHEYKKKRTRVSVALRQFTLLLSVPLWAACHTNVELTLRRTKCCFASIDVGVLHALVAGHDGNGTDLCRHTYSQNTNFTFVYNLEGYKNTPL